MKRVRSPDRALTLQGGSSMYPRLSEKPRQLSPPG
jgi:hypothetical protein